MTLQSSDQTLKILLNTDPLGVAEQITGKSYKDDDETSMLGLAIQMEKSRVLKQALVDAGDTCFSDTLSRYTGILSRSGFEKVLDIPFLGSCLDDADLPIEEYLQVWVHKEDGLFLRLDTYGGDHINSSQVYYCWEPRLKPGLIPAGITSSGRYESRTLFRRDWSFGEAPDDLYWIGDHDAREALLFKMESLRGEGKFLNPWPKSPDMKTGELPHFGMMSHYKDYARENVFDRIRPLELLWHERFKLLPQWVQDMTGFRPA